MSQTFVSLVLLTLAPVCCSTALADETSHGQSPRAVAHWAAFQGVEPHTNTHGLKSIRIVFDGFWDEDDGTSEKCGLDADGITAIVAHAVQDSGLIVRADDSEADATMEVGVGMGTGVENSTCTGMFRLLLTTTTTVALPYNSSPAPVKVFLQVGQGLNSGPSDSFAESFGKEIRTVSDRMMAEISLNAEATRASSDVVAGRRGDVPLSTKGARR